MRNSGVHKTKNVRCRLPVCCGRLKVNSNRVDDNDDWVGLFTFRLDVSRLYYVDGTQVDSFEQFSSAEGAVQGFCSRLDPDYSGEGAKI